MAHTHLMFGCTRHMKTLVLALFFLLLGIIIGFMFGKSNYQIPNILPLSCSFNNQTYKHGESFRDDCNTCSCQNGQVACTLMACDARPQ